MSARDLLADVPAETADVDAGARPSRLYLGVECALLFVALPLLLVLVRYGFGRLIVPSLVVLGLFCAVLLWRDPAFDHRRLWRFQAWRPHLRRIGLSFLVGATAVFIVLALAAPERLFGMLRDEPRVYVAILLIYPLFSAYPQEVIFRAFFFHRYRPLFTTTTARVLASSVAFALAHLFFANWIAPTLTLLGGVLFSFTYARTRSVVAASVEHALWGAFMFTVGLGSYFYGAAIPG